MDFVCFESKRLRKKDLANKSMMFYYYSRLNEIYLSDFVKYFTADIASKPPCACNKVQLYFVSFE